MANYTKVFDNPYPSGWENLPSENTPITAEALQEHTDAISHIENYLNDNPIKDATDVSWNQIQTSGDKIAEITIDGQKQDVFAPQQKGGASTWSEVAEKPFSTIGSGLRVQNDVLQSTDLSGTRAEFDAIKDSLPDGSAFDTTDENVGGSAKVLKCARVYDQVVNVKNNDGTSLQVNVPQDRTEHLAYILSRAWPQTTWNNAIVSMSGQSVSNNTVTVFSPANQNYSIWIDELYY